MSFKSSVQAQMSALKFGLCLLLSLGEFFFAVIICAGTETSSAEGQILIAVGTPEILLLDQNQNHFSIESFEKIMCYCFNKLGLFSQSVLSFPALLSCFCHI